LLAQEALDADPGANLPGDDHRIREDGQDPNGLDFQDGHQDESHRLKGGTRQPPIQPGIAPANPVLDENRDRLSSEYYARDDRDRGNVQTH
jgi:hypothetical protein